VAAGFFGALSGLGGGVFIVPGLVILAHVPIRVAVGASLISVVATSAGASVAFVRDGWTNVRLAMILECATVTGALIGAYIGGFVPGWVVEILFALMMLQSAYYSISQKDDEMVKESDPLCAYLRLGGHMPQEDGPAASYGVVNLPAGGALMIVAGVMSGLLGVGGGALKVTAMDHYMRIPLKVSSATSNFMIGVTAGAGAIVYLARGTIATTVAAPVALGVTVGALVGARILPYAQIRVLRIIFVVILTLIAIEMGWRALSGI
jgi:uncharacterized membrane protein YfcA